MNENDSQRPTRPGNSGGSHLGARHTSQHTTLVRIAPALRTGQMHAAVPKVKSDTAKILVER